MSTSYQHIVDSMRRKPYLLCMDRNVPTKFKIAECYPELRLLIEAAEEVRSELVRRMHEAPPGSELKPYPPNGQALILT